MFNKKMTLLYILDILREYSDENHLLTQQNIIDKLKAIYLIDIERKTISSTIDLLIEYGYDIIKNPSGGYYLNERDFNENEIKYLIDALYSSKSIPGSEAREISKKLYSKLSKYEQKDYSYLYKSTEVNRVENKDVFLNIELINEAIKQRKKITFEYLSYDENGKLSTRRKGYKYKVSPYFLINNFNKYYLLCNIDRFDNHANFRVEYMTNINILDEDINTNNLDHLYKLTKIKHMTKEDENMNYGNYGNYGGRRAGYDSYGEYGRNYGRYGNYGENYGRRGYDMKYRGEEEMDRMANEYGRYMESRERYGAGEETDKSFHYMVKALEDFIMVLKQEAESPEQKQQLMQALQNSMR